ncbi:MAG TPA: Swt1 family HEPN domain-containing protein, partial [Rhodothermales bacterium]|nr:Swt1 family HEPN domain-containing protein [Rhodothermales bacterium]
MALTNQQRVGRALDLLAEGLLPFVEREMKANGVAGWQDANAPDGRPLRVGDNWDAAALLKVMWDNWNLVFRKTLGHVERSIVSELRDVRNRWAHQNPFSSDDAYRAIDNVQRLLQAIAAPEAAEADKQKRELMRLMHEEQARREVRKATATATPSTGVESSGLKPWRELITPHPDVHSGRYQQAEFAADLGQVSRGEGSDEYRDPVQFFQRTFITEGLGTLLSGALQRLNGTGGDPVVELQTNFGGGKTHSMIALYHFFGGTPASELRDSEQVLVAAAQPSPGAERHPLPGGEGELPRANRAVLVGNDLPLAKPSVKEDGTRVHTMWGELAYRLLGAEGYALVQEADHKGVSPGTTALREIFTKAAPSLVLIDEWLTHARQLVGKDDLPAGTFDSAFSFAQELTEAARAVPRTLVVASIPSSDIEIGGEAGRDALQRLQNVFGRMESPWRSASAEESFEIVRRRLFQPMEAEHYTHRDAVIREFAKMYQGQKAEFPLGVGEGSYERRMKASYPIHPELFDRLYEDWSSLERFQRTRGVLRLMAAVIHALWRRDDRSLLIMPGSLPIDDGETMIELTRYLEDAWKPVIEKDVDGDDALPIEVDRQNPNFGRYAAARRVARTIYLGSAPKQKTATRGIEDRHIMLGCVQVGEQVSTFGDALRRLEDRATHLYVNENRYWFDLQPSITRLAQDRAQSQSQDAVEMEIVRRLGEERRRRGELEGIHIVERPEESADVPDERGARLVIIGPEAPHITKNDDSKAMQLAQAVLDQRGNSPRTYRNTLMFVAADHKRLEDLNSAVRQWLAWKSIDAERKELNLDHFQSKQVETKLGQAEDAVKARIPETYIWLIAPEQPDKTGPIELKEARLGGGESLAARVVKKMVNDETLMTVLGAGRLKLELDRIPLWRGEHVSTRQLADDFAQYIYLPRLKNDEVLLTGIRDAFKRKDLLQEAEPVFGYADFYHEGEEQYQGLYLSLDREPSPAIMNDSVVVKAEVAKAQIDAEKARRAAREGAAAASPVVEEGGAV